MKILPVLLLLLSTGCYFSKTQEDRPWSFEAVSSIEAGKSTKADVMKVLGPPTEIIRLLESEAYVYRHAMEKQTGAFFLIVNMRRVDRQYDAVTVIINREDIVTAVGSRFTADEAEYGFPWE